MVASVRPSKRRDCQFAHVSGKTFTNQAHYSQIEKDSSFDDSETNHVEPEANKYTDSSGQKQELRVHAALSFCISKVRSDFLGFQLPPIQKIYQRAQQTTQNQLASAKWLESFNPNTRNPSVLSLSSRPNNTPCKFGTSSSYGHDLSTQKGDIRTLWCVCVPVCWCAPLFFCYCWC